jgi:ribosome-binding ATPase
MSVVRSHSLSIGIVGLPNAGKSTLFNSLTKVGVPAENFPFCTIDKNVGVVTVPDKNLTMMEEFFKAAKTVPAAITFVDIAGLVKGASKGEGLGNQFLSHIREVDVIVYVLRAFQSETISHVYERVSPAEDLEIVQSELIFKDIEAIEKKLHEVNKRARAGTDKEAVKEKDLLDRVLAFINQGKPVVEMKLTEDEAEILNELWLLTNKKRVYVLNVRQGTDMDLRKAWRGELEAFVGKDEANFILEVDVKSLGEMADLDESSLAEYVEMLDGDVPVTIDELIHKAFARLDLITFYTGSQSEVNAWSITRGATAKEAAGVIHTDLANGFITADIVNVVKLIEAGGMAPAKEKGIVRNQGKDYLIQDGDYMIVFSSK